MSYILDALRKADAQRERDPARGIHAQPVRPGVGEQRVRERYRTGWWAATAAGVAALAIGSWTLYQDMEAAPVVPAAHTEVAATPPAVNVVPPPPAAAVLPPPVVVAPPVAPPPVVAAPATVAKPAPTPLAPAARPASTVAAATPAAPARMSPMPAQAAVASAPAAATATGPVVAAPAAPVPAPATAEAAAPVPGLPADAPKLAISGGVYSANAAQRMLIVNGQVFNEGGEVGPGMVLEEIRPKAAVLRFRGSRYAVPY